MMIKVAHMMYYLLKTQKDLRQSIKSAHAVLLYFAFEMILIHF